MKRKGKPPPKKSAAKKRAPAATPPSAAASARVRSAPSESPPAPAKAPDTIPIVSPLGEDRRRTFSGAPWEATVGYCRAIRAGAHVYVSGTAPVTETGAVFAPGDAYAQTRRCLDIALAALAKLGGEPRHVVRTRMYVTDISRWNDHGRAHGEVFHEHPPATAMVEVAGLIDPAMTIEVELDAVVD